MTQTSTDTATEGIARLPRIALVGVHGFGERHLDNLGRLKCQRRPGVGGRRRSPTPGRRNARPGGEGLPFP